MKRIFRKVSISGAAFFCFAVSIVAVMWWKSPSRQIYIPPKETSSIPSLKPLYNIKLNGKEGCMDADGKIVIEPKYDDIRCSNDLLIPIEVGNKWGYVNQSGEIILEPQFSLTNHGYSSNFSEGLAVVCQNGKCGYIDSNGKYAIEPKFDYANNFSEGIAIAGYGGYEILGYYFRFPKTVLINKAGEILFSDARFYPSTTKGFSDGVLHVSVDGKTAFINASGHFVIPPQEKYISDFSEGFAVYSYKSYNYGYVDKNGQVSIEQQFRQAGEFSEGLAAVMFENGKYGYIDKSGKTVIEPQFDVADTFYEGRAVVMIGLKKGYIDKTGKIVIPIQFGSAERFVNGLARVGFDDENPSYENKAYGYIDKSGNFVWQPTK